MSKPTDIPTDDPVVATFRFGPSYRMFTALWWLMGPVPFVLLAISVVRGGDPINLYIFTFLGIVPIPIWGLILWRSRIVITERHVVIRRLRKPVLFVRSDTNIKIMSIGGTPMARISDGRQTRESRSVTAMRRGSRKLRRLATYVPVTMHNRSVDPLPGPDELPLPRQ